MNKIEDLELRLKDVQICLDAYYDWVEELSADISRLAKERRQYAKKYYALVERMEREDEI